MEYLLLLLPQIRFLRNPRKTVPLICPVKCEVLNIISSAEINDDINYFSKETQELMQTQIDIRNTFLRCVDEMPIHYHFVLLAITP